MKLLINLIVLASIALPCVVVASHHHDHGHHHEEHHHQDHHGHHEHHGHEDHHGHHHPYGFGYDVKDGHGNTQYRHEKSSHPHLVKGSYGYKDKHGIGRSVDYIADEHGFRAHIKTNEPGTAPKDPAAVKMDSHPVHPHEEPHHEPHGHGDGHYHHSEKHSESYHHPNHYASAANIIPIKELPSRILQDTESYLGLFK